MARLECVWADLEDERSEPGQRQTSRAGLGSDGMTLFERQSSSRRRWLDRRPDNVLVLTDGDSACHCAEKNGTCIKRDLQGGTPGLQQLTCFIDFCFPSLATTCLPQDWIHHSATLPRGVSTVTSTQQRLDIIDSFVTFRFKA